jgi:hypothetical protein
MPYIYANPYKASFEAAKQELLQRKAELTALTLRVQYLEATIRTLEPLAFDDSIAPIAGLPELCAQALRALNGIGMTAQDVSDALKYRGVDLSNYSNPLSMLHTVLTRLCKPGSGFVKGKSPSGPMYAFDDQLMNDAYRSGMRG